MLYSDVLQGEIGLNEAKNILGAISELWSESNVWYEFFEQLVYILVSITFPSLARGAMGKVMGKIIPWN